MGLVSKYAAFSTHGSSSVVEQLLRKGGASAAIENKKNRYTALCYACYTGHIKCVRALLRAKQGLKLQQSTVRRRSRASY